MGSGFSTHKWDKPGEVVFEGLWPRVGSSRLKVAGLRDAGIPAARRVCWEDLLCDWDAIHRSPALSNPGVFD